MTDTGQQPGNGLHGRDLFAGKIIQDSCFVVDGFRSVVPAVFFEFFTDPDQFVDHLGTVASGRLLWGSGARVECAG